MSSLKNLSLDVLEKTLPSDILDELVQRRMRNLILPKIMDIHAVFHEVRCFYNDTKRKEEFYSLLLEFEKEFPEIIEPIESLDKFAEEILTDEQLDRLCIWKLLFRQSCHGVMQSSWGIRFLYKKKKNIHTLCTENIQDHNAVLFFFFSRGIALTKGISLFNKN